MYTLLKLELLVVYNNNTPWIEGMGVQRCLSEKFKLVSANQQSAYGHLKQIRLGWGVA